jgi:hypothetical protein
MVPKKSEQKNRKGKIHKHGVTPDNRKTSLLAQNQCAFSKRVNFGRVAVSTSLGEAATRDSERQVSFSE